jgi:cytochrome P450
MVHLDKMSAEVETRVGVHELDLHGVPFVATHARSAAGQAIRVITSMATSQRQDHAERMSEILLSAPPKSETRRWKPIVRDCSELHHPKTAEIAHVPGRRGLPIVGIMPEALLDPLAFSERMVERFGPVYRFHAFGKWHVHLNGPEANELLLFDETGIFSAREGWGQLIEPLFPGALLLKDGPEHRLDRRVLAEAFKQAQLTDYQQIFDSDIRGSVDSWLGRRIAPYPEIRKLTFRIAASTFLGAPLEQEAKVAIRSLGQMIRSLLAMGTMPSLARARGRVAKARLERILVQLIAEKRLQPGTDFLSRLANLRDDEGRLLAVTRICESFSFLLSAAHDTLASSLTSLIYYLAAHPEWASDLRDELRSTGIREPIEAATATLPLLDMFYKETLRLNGPAPVVWRRAVREFTIYGHRIPAGTMCGANLMMAHRLSSVWPEPARFDPTRFTPEAERARGRFAFIPFGAGVHKCLGMHFAQQQARIFVAFLLQRADLRLSGRKPVRWYQWPNCRPRGPFFLDVLPRCHGK